MEKALNKIQNNQRLHHYVEGKYIAGKCSWLRGNCSGLRGNLDFCELNKDDRLASVDIALLVSPACDSARK